MVEVQQQNSSAAMSLEEEEPTSLSPIDVDDDDPEEMTQYELQCAAWEHTSSDIQGLLEYNTLAPDLEDHSGRAPRSAHQLSDLDKDYPSKGFGPKDEWNSEDTVHAEITIPINKVGLLIGRGGRTIKSLQERTRTRMHIIQDMTKHNADDPMSEVLDKTLIITGSQESVIQAEELIYDFISKAPSTPPPSRHRDPYPHEHEMSSSGQQYSPDMSDRRSGPRNTNRSGRIKTIRIPVPKLAVGLIIGKGGESIKRIRIETGAKVQFNPLTSNINDMDDQTAVITGRGDQIRHACDLIEELIETAMNSKPTDEHAQRRRLPSRSETSWSENFSGPASFQSLGQGPGQPEPVLDVEEERLAIPMEKIRKVIGKGREIIRNISLVSGATCELDRAPSDGPERVIFISGQRSQIEHAKELIYERVNFVGGGENQVNEPQFVHPNPEQFGPGPNVGHQGHEWAQAQEQPAPWSYYEPAYYDPIQLGYQDYYMNVPANSSGDYSQWAQYFQPPVDPVPPQNPTWAGPGPQAQEPKPEPIPPVPIMSATIVQNTDRSLPYPTPPTVYFSIPTSPFHPPMNMTTSHGPPPQPPQPQQQPQPQHSEPEPVKVTVSAEVLQPSSSNNPDGDHEEKEAQPTKLEEPQATGGGDHSESPLNPKEDGAEEPQPPPGFEPYTVIPPNAVPGLSYPSNIGTPGSCTRIVSFYYDLNVNSIVILNQWHFY